MVRAGKRMPTYAATAMVGLMSGAALLAATASVPARETGAVRSLGASPLSVRQSQTHGQSGLPDSSIAEARLDFVGQIGGAALTVVGARDVVYLGAGPTVRQFDPDPLTRPGLMASSPVLEDVVRSLALHDDRLLVAAGRQGLVVLDTAAALAVANVITWTTPAHGVAVAGGRAYVAVPDTGVMILDPLAPTPVLGTVPISTVVGPLDARPDGWGAALTSSGVLVVDARDPVSTTFGAPFDPAARALDIEGDHLLVAGATGLRVYAMTGDLAPQPLGEWTGGPATAVRAAGSRAYVALADGTGVVLSILDPANPTEESAFRLAGWGAALEVAGGRVFAAVNRGPPDTSDPYALGGGLEVMDDEGSSPTRRSLLEMPSGRLTDLDLEAGAAWAVEAPLGAESRGRAWAFDILEPSNPVPMGSAPLEGTPQGAAVIPPYGFFATSAGLHVTRNTQDGLLRPVKFLPAVQPGPADLWAWGYHIWAVGGTNVFEVLDATYPLDVRSLVLSSHPDLMSARSVAVTEGRAYAAGENGLAVVDVRERSHPRTLARMTALGPASGVAVLYPAREMPASSLSTLQHVALVANRVDGLRVVDARSVSQITEVGRLGPSCPEPPAQPPTCPGLAGVAAYGPAAYLLGLNGAVTLVDVARPDEPKALAASGLPAFASDAEDAIERAHIDAGHDIVAVAHPERGMLVYAAYDAPAPTPTPVLDPKPVHMPALYRAAPASYPRHSLALRGAYAPINTRPFGFQVVGDIAYVGQEGGVSDWVATVDLSSPSVPLHIGRSDDLGGTPLRIAAGRGFAYVATGAGGLKVVDATNPLLPVVVGTFDTQADLMNVVLSPDQRHVAGLESLGGAGSTQLVVYDVTDPSRPSETGRLALTEGAAAVSLAWPAGYSRVVVTAPSEGVMLVELADVARPRLIARRPLQGAGEAVVRRGDVVPVPSLVGVVNRGSELVPGGLWMLSLSASDDDLLEAGTLVSIDWPDVQGARQASWWDRLLIAASEDDLALYDTRDPSRPRLTFELVDEFQDIHEVQLDGRFAYVSDPIDGFVLLDVIPDR